MKASLFLVSITTTTAVFAVSHLKIKQPEIPKFEITSSRSLYDPPSISVSFPNGVKDDLVLEHYKLRKDAKGGCNFLGYLKRTIYSSAAVTGCLDKPGDQMEITLISDYNSDKLFVVDYFRNTKVIQTPFQNGKTSRAVIVNRGNEDARDGDKWTQKGDEEIDEEEENAAESTEVASIPSKLKAVIKFGYYEGLKKQIRR